MDIHNKRMTTLIWVLGALLIGIILCGAYFLVTTEYTTTPPPPLAAPVEGDEIAERLRELSAGNQETPSAAEVEAQLKALAPATATPAENVDINAHLQALTQ